MRLTNELLKTISLEVSELVLAGTPVEIAIADTWAKYRIPQVLFDSARADAYPIIKKMLGLETLPLGMDAGRAWDKLVGNDPEVRRQIAKASARARYDVEKAVKGMIKESAGVRETAVKLEEKASGDYSVVRKDLKKIAEFGGSKKEIEKLRRTITSGVKGAPLKSAYRAVLKAVEDGNEKQLQKKIDLAVMQKTRYNAERVLRTEGARTTFATDRENIARQGVRFVRFVLAGGHEADECDAYATADMGYGAGVYPIDQAPVLPIHPNGKSRLMPVTIPKKNNPNGLSADEALLEAGAKKEVKINNIKFEPITRKL